MVEPLLQKNENECVDPSASANVADRKRVIACSLWLLYRADWHIHVKKFTNLNTVIKHGKMH